MIRYFISYKEYTKQKETIDDSKIRIFKKNKDGSYRVDLIIYFSGYTKDILNYANKLEKNTKGIYIMVELLEEEIKDFNSLYIKKLESEDNKNYYISNDSNEIKLINYTTYVNMTNKEITSGNTNCLVALTVDNDEKATIKVYNKDNYYEHRNKILKNNISSDIYFYTDDEEILNRYKNDLTVIEEKELDTYKINKHKIFTIDSIPQERIYDLNASCIKFVYDVCDRSIPINITLLDDEFYKLSLDKGISSKKVYMITEFDIKNIMCDTRILPLLKYLNVFELDNGTYKKTNLEEYMKRENILKYIKKPSKC